MINVSKSIRYSVAENVRDKRMNLIYSYPGYDRIFSKVLSNTWNPVEFQLERNIKWAFDGFNSLSLFLKNK